jgi:tetratricopeptide (TPR) repeat protein
MTTKRQHEAAGASTAAKLVPFAALLAVGLAMGWAPFAADAAEACTPVVARVVSAQGQVELRRARQTDWRSAQLDDELCAGDTVRVAARARGALRLHNQSVMRLDQNTTLTLGDFEGERSLIEVIRGAIHVLTRTAKPFKVDTPFLNGGIEGTEFYVLVAQTSATLGVVEGKVLASNGQGSVRLAGGEAASAERNQAPKKTLILNPLDAVQWALYYPAILDARTSSASTQRASELLAVGRADEAGAELEQILKNNPRDSDALALQSIVALTRNDKARALSQAQQAVQADSKSAAAKLALSYAQQAHFDIEQARATAKEAVDQQPGNALAWARLAELHLSAGDRDAALEAAQRATELNPNLAKTQTVLGFAHLARIDTSAAKAAFDRAIELDQADPLPRLGLGLAEIRTGQLEAGREKIEIASGLDPGSSLIRSYLGKSYFEEKRDELAATQFELAKARDPKDPTPWFYDAIRKQTENRPVEALRDLGRSIELNDNRAVYRSQLLLDSDEAARGTSLARIYNDLGFSQLAVQEATKSLSIDPSDHSSHRFLSDAYANIPRHETARVSELLQSQLLQPININPVQPRMAVSDLYLITGAGPAEASFNEFTPMFERNRPQFSVSALTGNNGTLGDEMVLSGVQDRLSYSVGQFYHTTDGFRDNNDVEHRLYNAFIQYAFTPQFNVQAEVRTRRTEHGDLLMNFNPDVFTQDRREIDQDTFRLGARFSLSAREDLLLSYFNGKRKESQFTAGNPIQAHVNRDLDEDGYQAEAQYLFRGEHFNVIAGAATYSIDIDDVSNYDFTPVGIGVCPLPPSFCHQESEASRTRRNAYFYTDIRLPANLIWTVGLSYDSYDERDKQFHEWNPKVGLQWEINDVFRLRAAYIEVLKPALIADQTLEPTHVAGFNQLFDDANGTWSRRKGIGLDARFAQGTYGGIEWSGRDLQVPLGGTRIEPQDEELYRAYMYWAFHRDWALSADAQYERMSRRQLSGITDLVEIKTHSVPIGLHYFRSSGMFASLTGTYVRQEIEREPATFALHEDNFFLVDASIGYRLAKRKGMISLEAKNIFDEEFFYRDTNFQISEPIGPRFIPDRTVLLRLMLNF